MEIPRYWRLNTQCYRMEGSLCPTCGDPAFLGKAIQPGERLHAWIVAPADPDGLLPTIQSTPTLSQFLFSGSEHASQHRNPNSHGFRTPAVQKDPGRTAEMLIMKSTGSDLHDAYASDYDAQVQVYKCHIDDLLFGLTYEYIQPGNSLLDIGIGSGLSSMPFTKAGLEIHGMDFSAFMLRICQSKGIAMDLKQHDIQQIPWPYPSGSFDTIISCGVFHFLGDLDVIFGEVQRVLTNHGIFTFTTRFPTTSDANHQEYEMYLEKDFEIFSHLTSYVERLLDRHRFKELKRQKCFVGDDLFLIWLAQTG